MSRWFRFYNDAFANPKVLALSDREFRLWVRLLSVASTNEGLIPPLTDLKRLLNARLDHLSTGVRTLVEVGLIDIVGGGFTPHNWLTFQYKSDNSTARVRRHRDGRGNVSVTSPETGTETDTENYLSQERDVRGVEIARERLRVIGGGQ